MAASRQEQRSRWSIRASSAVLAIVGAVAFGGCGASAADTPLTVYAASSLREVLPAIDSAARFSFAGSDELARQIREGAPADVYVAANARLPAALSAEGLVERPVTFAGNRVVLLLPAANPAKITTVADVARPGVSLVIADAGVPVGDYTRDVLERLALEGALSNVASNEKDAKGVVAKVALGEADAGFAYATDVTPAGDKVRVIPIPQAAQPAIVYQIAVVASSDHIDAARAFVAAVTGADGRAALRAAGFTVPSP